MGTGLALESLFDQSHQAGRRDRFHDVVRSRTTRFCLEHFVVKARDDNGWNGMGAEK